MNTHSGLLGRKFVAAVTVGGLALLGCAERHGIQDRPGGGSGEQKSLEAVLHRVRSEHAVPALAAAFVRDREIVAAAVGVRRNDRDVRVALDDRFHIGSVSKPITATVIATLVEERLLDWDTTVAGVFPDLSGQVKAEYLSVTLEQLLSHRGGIVAWEEDEEISLAPVVTGTPTEQRRASLLWLLNQTPAAPPGAEHVYSNAGYMIAAAMAEQATGVAWEDLVLDRMAKALDLPSLGFGWPGSSDPNQPWGHVAASNGFVPQAPGDSYQAGPLLGPAGDLHMSITDLARFARLHLEGLQGNAALVSTGTFRKLHAPFGDYALGWNVRETADHHMGGLGTFHAVIWVSVPRNVAVVAVTNCDADARVLSAVINGSLRAFNVAKP